MVPVLIALFVVLPIVEIALILQVGSALGVLPTVALLLGMAVAGGVLAKRQGLKAMQDVRIALTTGREVGANVVSAALVLVASVLMLTPGFVSDVGGILLLIPPVRKLVARYLASRFAAHARVRTGGPPNIIDI